METLHEQVMRGLRAGFLRDRSDTLISHDSAFLLD